MNKSVTKRFKSIALCALMVASLTLGGARADDQFPQDDGPIYGSLNPLDIWPTEYGQV